MDETLRKRLHEAGVDPGAITDPSAAWLRLYETFGLRATLIERYAIEAVHRGIEPADLAKADRDRMGLEVLKVRYPGIELVGGPSGHPIEVVSYDASWPETFQTWRGRIGDALDNHAIAVEHVGSTAVPGLAAKPIVDVQVSVESLNDLALVPAIESTGVPLRSREPDHLYFRPPHDAPREVQIHVCEVGSEWERIHLLFRDYLRSHTEVRGAYAALKLELATVYADDRLAYTDAKTGFILDAIDQAEGWAAETGWSVR